MYISKVIIKNYRSIKDITLNFLPEKNVIVGKNNSGKSNIIKAIDIVLGENSPTYIKSNNITINDFYSENGNIAKNLMIFCELKKNVDEELDKDSLKTSRFYGRYKNNLYMESDIENNTEILYKKQEDFENEKNGSLLSLYYKSSDFEKNFEQNIWSKNKFAFVFTANVIENVIEKDLKFLVYNDSTEKWNVFFGGQLRNVLLQSAIIPAFREPSQQLSLSQWSWYGKMMRKLTSSVSKEKWSEYREIYNKVSEVSDNIFNEITEDINVNTLKIAFPNTKLYFKFLEDKKTDLYKSTRIFVDDGFLSDISLKGAGVQSSIIIGLYTYYVKNISKIKNALLCLEEPELYLHPHGKRIISNRVNDFLNIGDNQAIIVTHASEFIELKNKNSRIIKINKELEKGSIASEINLDECKEVILKNENKEVFFADKIILCEGKDKLLLEFLNLNYLDGKFDDNNISIISVDGKNNFKKYVEIAEKINTEVYIIADFDYLLRDNNEEKIKQYNGKYHGDISNLGLKDLQYISKNNDNKLQTFIGKLRRKLILFDEEKFYSAKSINEFESFEFAFKGETLNIRDCIKNLQNNNIFIEDSEIEGIFNNFGHSKMNENDIYKLYESNDVDSEFDMEKLNRLLEFLKQI